MDIKVMRLTATAQLPLKAHTTDIGWDLYSDTHIDLFPGDRALVKTGVSVRLPRNVAGLVVPRSGLALRYGVTVLNAPGLIDPGYTGEIGVVLLNTSTISGYTVYHGERIAQLVFQSVPDVTLVDASDETDATVISVRGNRGFGSSGS